MYINDMVYLCPDKAVDLYADDSMLHKSGTNINDIQNRLQNYLNRINSWCKYNNMALHPGKSKCMLIGPPSKLSQFGELQLTINGQKLENVKHKNVLGLHIDNHLNWKEQVNIICKRLNATIALLKIINYYLCPEMKPCSITLTSCRFLITAVLFGGKEKTVLTKLL